MITLRWVDREFHAAIREFDKVSPRSAFKIVTDQAQRLLRKLAWNTPKYTPAAGTATKKARKVRGRARAGWWNAWKRLRMDGTPYVGNSQVLSLNEGSFKDGRRSLLSSFFTMINTVPYIDTLDDENQIIEKAQRGRLKDLERVTENLFAREMRKRSG